MSILEFYDRLTEQERLMTDMLREIVKAGLPDHCKEKFTNNVPYYFGKKRICMVWPASIKGGGIKKGVMLGFSKGNLLRDEDHYLDHGSNKRIYYKIYQHPDQIDADAILKLLQEAVRVDNNF